MVVSFTRDSLQQIRDRIDMVELVNSYTRLERRGDRWWGLSPFKTEKTPSFTVKPEEGFYYCFSTQRGGDLFKFVCEMEGLSFPEAVRYLAERAGVTLEEGRQDPDASRKQQLEELYRRVAGTFHWLLTQDPRGGAALEYLGKRGITETTMNTFQLGYTPENPRWLYQFLQDKSYSAAFLDESGLFSRRSRGFPLFRHRLMFPIADERRRVLAFGGRALQEHERAKYINSPETLIYRKKQVLYGVQQAVEAMRARRSVYIAEGYLDVLALHQAGVPNAVAPLGTAFTEEQGRLLRRWVDDITLVFDADSAGFSATLRAAAIAEKCSLGCHVVALQNGTDPADLLKEDGEEAVAARMETAVTAWDFILEHTQRRLSLGRPEERELLLRNVLPYISMVTSEVRREAMLTQVADVTGVSLSAVQRDYTTWRGGGAPHNTKEQVSQTDRIHRSRDITLVTATIQGSGLFAYLRKHIGVADLQDPAARELFLAAEDAFRHEEPFPRGVLDRLEDEILRDMVLEGLTSGSCANWSEVDVRDAVRRLRIEKLLVEEQAVVRAMKQVSPDDWDTLRTLQEQKMAMDQEIRDLKARVDDRIAE